MELCVGNDSGMHKIKVPTVTLTFDLATWFLQATRLVLMIICAKYFSNPTMHDEVVGWTLFWKQTNKRKHLHTNEQDRLHMPFRQA